MFSKYFSSLLLIIFLINIINSVPFVTKRVSLHNPINIDFSGWIPLRSKPEPEIMETSGSQEQSQHIQRPEMMASLDNHYLTVPVAVETDLEHQLSQMDLNMISKQVLQNWNQNQNQYDQQNNQHDTQLPSQLLSKLIPKPEIELTKDIIKEQIREETEQQTNEELLNTNETEYTFVKMDKNLLLNNKTNEESPSPSSLSSENLFHAYFAPKEHVPPEGYIKLSKNEFKSLFKNAEILFV